MLRVNHRNSCDQIGYCGVNYKEKSGVTPDAFNFLPTTTVVLDCPAAYAYIPNTSSDGITGLGAPVRWLLPNSPPSTSPAPLSSSNRTGAAVYSAPWDPRPPATDPSDSRVSKPTLTQVSPRPYYASS